MTHAAGHIISNKDTPSFEEVLRAADLSVTPFRLDLLAVLEREHIPLSAQSLIEKFSEPVDKVTLYRNLESFEHAGLICRMYFTGQEALYEQRFRPHHHHHLVCTTCGQVEDIEECVVHTPAPKSGFRTDHHHLEFYGTCAQCQQKGA